MREVIFTGCSEAQRKWGCHTGNDSLLVKGKIYVVEKEEVHSWHIKYYLQGFEGSFNSVCFE